MVRLRQHHYKENSRSMIKGKVVWRHVRRSSQIGLASPITTFGEVVPSTMSMCHSVMAGWAPCKAPCTEQVCPLPRAQKSNVPAQFLLGQGVSFPFSSPSTHKMCKFHIPCSKGSSSTQNSDGAGCEVDAGISTTEERDGPVVHSASCSSRSRGVCFSLCQCGFWGLIFLL